MISKTLMLIDSDTSQHQMLEEQLSERHYQFLSCASLQEAVVKSRHFSVDILFISSEWLPESSLPTFYQLKTHLPDLFTVLMIPATQSTESLNIPVEDIDSYIVKPLLPEMVKITLRQAETLLRRQQDADRAVRELRRQKSFYQHLLNGFPEAVVVIDENSSILYCNNAFESLIEQPSEVLFDQHLYDFLEDGYKILHHLRQQLKSQPSVDGYMVTIRTDDGDDGIAANMNASVLPVDSDNNTLILVKLEHYSISQERFMLSVRKEKLSTIQYLSNALAHEIQNPMNILSGRVQLLEQQYSDPGAAKSISIINQQLERISGIIGQLRKFNVNKSDTVPESFPLIPFLEAYIAQNEGENAAQFQLHYLPEYGNLRVKGNRLQIGDALGYLFRTVKRLVDPKSPLSIDFQLLNAPSQSPHLELQIDLPKSNIPETLFRDFNSLDLEPNDRYSVLDIALLHSILTSHSGEVSIARRSNQQTRIRILFTVASSPVVDETESRKKVKKKS